MLISLAQKLHLLQKIKNKKITLKSLLDLKTCSISTQINKLSWTDYWVFKKWKFKWVNAYFTSVFEEI